MNVKVCLLVIAMLGFYNVRDAWLSAVCALVAIAAFVSLAMPQRPR